MLICSHESAYKVQQYCQNWWSHDRLSCFSIRFPAKIVFAVREDLHNKGCRLASFRKVDPRSNSYSYTPGSAGEMCGNIRSLQFALAIMKILRTQELTIWFWSDLRPILKHGNAKRDSVYLHHLAPSSNRTKRKSDNPWLGASIGCTRCTTRSNAWRTLSNTSFYTFGGGNDRYLMLDLVISQPFQSHEMKHVKIKILKNNIYWNMIHKPKGLYGVFF